MLETNLESRPFAAVGKDTGHRGLQTLWVWASLVFLVALFPVSVTAQSTSQTSVAPGQGSAYGTGAQTPLRFEGQAADENQVSLNVGASGFFDDNVLARDDLRLSDEGVAFTSHLGVQKQTSNLTFNFNYLPFFMLYRQISQYDRLNHAANLSLAYRLSPRVVLGLHDTFSYQNGVFPSLSGQQILSGPTPPTGLNQGIYAYTTRNLSNVAGLNLAFVKSRRNSVTISAGYNILKYGDQSGGAEPLYHSFGLSGGLQYQYRVTEHNTLGVLLLHQDTTYMGGIVFGNLVRDQIETGYLSLGSRLSPTLSVTVFGGPQYVHVLGEPSGISALSGHLQGAFGGSVTKEARATAFEVSFQRAVTDSGGLYTSVVNTNVSLGVRRRLFGRWDGDFHSNAYRVDASLFQLANGSTEAVNGGIEFSRPVGERSKLRISYDCIHQISQGTLPIFQNFDRDQVTVGMDFQLKSISLGQ